MMILEPKKHTAKKPLVYYGVFAWSNSETYADRVAYFEYAGEAIAECKRLVNSGAFSTANVREEIVYRRTSKGEFSTSGVIFSL